MLTNIVPGLYVNINQFYFQLPVSPGGYSDNSNHAMSMAGMGHYRTGFDNLPISDNNVSTTNDALDTGEWDMPGEDADIDVSNMTEGVQDAQL